MKKLLSVIIAAVMALLPAVSVAYANDGEIRVYLNSAEIEFDIKPQIIDGRTMVPIRAIFENMGASVVWDENTNSAVCTKGNTVVKIMTDSTDMQINDQVIKMDVSPAVIDGRALAPARYVAEAFGADVQWSTKNNAVVICSKDVYAYADYPDIPDLGRCYNIPLVSESNQDGYNVLSYVYSDMSNDDYYSYLYDNSALVLERYAEESIDNTDGALTIAYTKPEETTPRYFIVTSYDENDSMVFNVMIPNGTAFENTVIMYALDGRTIEVFESEVPAYMDVGWYGTVEETQQTLYAADGRTITVFKAEVPAYMNVGWYRTIEETQQTLYAADGRTITVFKSEVPAYKNVGWYESYSQSQAANKTTRNSSASSNPSADGYYYRTPSGKRYHLDPNCGGKNSYRTTDISGLSPCAKCAR